MNTALIGGVTVLDVNVNPAPGATVAPESGWDYTQQIVSAPEPAAFGMIAIGLVLMSFWPRSWRSARRATP